MADPKGIQATGDKKTFVEEGTQLKGSLSSSCPVVVRGKIEGEVSAPSLTISASGAVHGTVKVAEIHSEGELAGDIDADLVRLSGRVQNNTVIRARSLEVKLTPARGKMEVVFGDCILDVGELPSKEAAIGAVTASGTPETAPAKPLPSNHPPAINEPIDVASSSTSSQTEATAVSSPEQAGDTRASKKSSRSEHSGASTRGSKSASAAATTEDSGDALFHSTDSGES